jgi:hypothetical protein
MTDRPRGEFSGHQRPGVFAGVSSKATASLTCGGLSERTAMSQSPKKGLTVTFCRGPEVRKALARGAAHRPPPGWREEEALTKDLTLKGE